jgi:hypothetical protein
MTEPIQTQNTLSSMADELGCFEYVHDNVPTWISNLERLDLILKVQRTEFLRTAIPSRRLKKSDSNESIRPNSVGDDAQFEGSTLTGPQETEMTSIPLRTTRKRKPSTTLSNDTISSKWRTRNMVIVYYDSEIQKIFEDVVRGIGFARNNIRKTRMALQVAQRMLQTQDSLQKAAGDEDNKLVKENSLSRIDTSLETAQSRCEHGAHMFLREGACEAEILEAKKCFHDVKALSEQEIKILSEKLVSKPVSEAEIKDIAIFATSELGIIDIDDESDEGDDKDIVLTLPPRFAMRTTRVMTLT